MTEQKSLKDEVQECSWKILDKSIEREAVFILDEKLDLVQVGQAIVDDNKIFIQELLNKQSLVKVLMDDGDKYSNTQFNFLIIQPFVLIQIKNLE